MIPIYLCEDEDAIRARLRREIENHVLIQNHDMAVVCATGDPKALLEHCHESQESGIYFLDVDLGMEGFDGFELAQAIRRHDSRGVIIFVTTHGELSMETFRYRLEAFDYILKDDAEAMLDRVRESLDSVQERLARQRAETSEYYTVKVFDTLHNIPVSHILYFETSHQKHRIRLHAEHEVLEFFDNLQSIEDKMGRGFFRCHRSTLVNRDKMRAVHFKENQVELSNGERLPLSRKAKKGLGEEPGQ